MRKIVHVSDLHFGRDDALVIDGLTTSIHTIDPHLIIISGDLTQRARDREFERARRYCEMLAQAGFPFLVIPGNHDITPLYHPMKRIFNTYDNYRKYISEHTQAQYADKEVAVASINSVSRVRPSGGFFLMREVKRTSEWLADFPDSMVKIVVTHHPIHAPYEKPTKRTIGGNRTLKALGASKVDLFLAGHFHKSRVIPLAQRFDDHGGLAIQAGTVSRRLRGEAPSFNLLTIDKPHLTLEALRWSAADKRFAPAKKRDFFFRDEKWVGR